jgi:anthranilate 1,2-dioxygenase small subunit
VTLIDLFATAKYLDEVVRDAGSAKFAERTVVLASRNVDIPLVLPL